MQKMEERVQMFVIIVGVILMRVMSAVNGL